MGPPVGPPVGPGRSLKSHDLTISGPDMLITGPGMGTSTWKEGRKSHDPTFPSGPGFLICGTFLFLLWGGGGSMSQMFF